MNIVLSPGYAFEIPALGAFDAHAEVDSLDNAQNRNRSSWATPTLQFLTATFDGGGLGPSGSGGSW